MTGSKAVQKWRDRPRRSTCGRASLCHGRPAMPRQLAGLFGLADPIPAPRLFMYVDYGPGGLNIADMG